MATGDIRVKLGDNGRIVIPVDVRRDLGIKAGDYLILEKDEVGYRLTTQERRLKEARRSLRRYIKPGKSMVDELIAERREAAKHE